MLMLIPKKYPRLLLGLVPAAALATGILTTQWKAGSKFLVLTPMIAWLILGSMVTIPPNPLRAKVDEGCPQYWLRPARAEDFGLAEIAQQATDMDGDIIAIHGNLIIPCQLQTTHPWSDHLEPYLRRFGLEKQIISVSEKEAIWQQAGLQIQWEAKSNVLWALYISTPTGEQNMIQYDLQ